MSEVDNKDPMERIIHQAFHDIADKYEIDVDLVSEIISEYNKIMDEKLEKKIIVHSN